MSLLAYTTIQNLTAGQPENINDVMQCFLDSQTLVNGNLDAANLATSAKPATLLGAYRTVAEVDTFLSSAQSGANTWIPSGGGSVVLLGANGGPAIFPITLADYTVTGLTTQFRVQTATITNTVAPAVNFTFALQKVATVGGTAGSILIASLAAAPTSVTRTTPAASSMFVDATSDFTVSSDGVYVLTVASSGTPAANSFQIFRLRLQVHHT